MLTDLNHAYEHTLVHMTMVRPTLLLLQWLDQLYFYCTAGDPFKKRLDPESMAVVSIITIVVIIAIRMLLQGFNNTYEHTLVHIWLDQLYFYCQASDPF